MDDYIRFKNGSEIKTLAYDFAVNTRGNRSKIIGTQCYDIETDQWIFKELDITQPIGRYIPESMFIEYLNRKEG